ncbi:MAG: DNA-binding response regulator [Chloroflexi bacterium]|nr:MAG: DNA-binding response regulator [Chloroflexota bacterium]
MLGAKVLVVEDDATLLQVLRYNLAREGYNVLTAAEGDQALQTALRERPDLVILDIMLPRIDGLEVCRILRQEMTVPILMLTAKSEEIDKVVGLEIGADDYMTKPFGMKELLARVRAMLRRAGMLNQRVATDREEATIRVKAGPFEADLDCRAVSFGGAVLDLTRKEFDLLVYLMRNRGRVFSRDHLLDRVWGYDYAGDTRTVDVHVSWLRRKLEPDPAHPRYLVTVRGVGYKFEA